MLVEQLEHIAAKHKLKILEDNAQAAGLIMFQIFKVSESTRLNP